jgi:hypothetical protein
MFCFEKIKIDGKVFNQRPIEKGGCTEFSKGYMIFASVINCEERKT